MTIDEAIKWLKEHHSIDLGTQDDEAHRMAIKALETLEEFERAQIITGGRLNGRTYAYKCGLEDGKRKALGQEPCDDCISRERTMLRVREFIENQTYTEKMLVDDLNALPSVTPQPKTGHWIDHDKHIECDKCKTWFLKDHLIRKTYCPNCGCCMVEPQERSDKE